MAESRLVGGWRGCAMAFKDLRLGKWPSLFLCYQGSWLDSFPGGSWDSDDGPFRLILWETWYEISG